MKQLRQDEIQELLKLFNQRAAYWAGEGYIGAQVYEQLATDTELPENFETPVIAAILRVKPSAIAQRRKRGDPPSFIRAAQNWVIYPRHAFCLFLRDRFVDRRTALAAPEYTTTA